MTEGSSPGNPGGSSASTPGSGISQKKQYELLILDAKANPAQAAKYYRQAANLARDGRDLAACSSALTALADVYMQLGKHEDELNALKEISAAHSSSPKQSLFMVTVEKRIGQCYAKLRQPDKSIEHLRAAVTRCQSVETDSIDEFIDCLCSLSSIYRQKSWFDRARACIKQAYSLVSDDPERLDLQARVLEELASNAQAQRRPKEGAIALIRVLKLKQAAFGVVSQGCIDTLISLGICYDDMHSHDEAESAFTQALELMRYFETDRNLHASTLNKLAGIYRKQGRFMEASLIEQGTSEIVGRGVDQRLGFFQDFDTALSAQRAKQYDIALNGYRQALVNLEFLFDKLAFIRVPVLCRMAEIADERKLKVQSRSLGIEIEEGLRQLSQRDGVDTCTSLLQLARLFRLLRFDVFADSCYRFAERIQRKQPDERMLAIMHEHLQLLHTMASSQETRLMHKYLRRACKALSVSGALALYSSKAQLIHDVRYIESADDIEIIIQTV